MVPAAYTEVASCEAVIVVLPIPTMVTAPVVELTVATDVFELVYVKAPSLLVAGAVRLNAAAP